MKDCLGRGSDRIAYAGDPEHVKPLPLGALFAPQYAAAQKERINMDVAEAVPGESYTADRPVDALATGDLEFASRGHTTHFEVADRDGNMIGITQTLGGYFGCGIAAGDTGIFLNNMTTMADLAEHAPNRLGPGRNLANPLSPTQIFRDSRMVLSLGMPGGWAILQRTGNYYSISSTLKWTSSRLLKHRSFACMPGATSTLKSGCRYRCAASSRPAATSSTFWRLGRCAYRAPTGYS